MTKNRKTKEGNEGGDRKRKGTERKTEANIRKKELRKQGGGVDLREMQVWAVGQQHLGP